MESLHRDLGHIMWENCGMARNEINLTSAISEIQSLKRDFWDKVSVPGRDDVLNPELEKAGRVADFIELGELMVRDALDRRESCGGHFREESQTEEGEAKRDDENFTFSSAWEYTGEETEPTRNKEELTFDTVQLTQRSYK